ncbi:MAG: sulfite exporter TauE/SafE family protein [Pseudolabrys sp.]
MDILTIAFLAGAGVIAGIIAAMVGGAAVVIYPALIATGVPPHLAAVSNLASIMPATMLAALSDRSQLPPFDRSFLGLIAASIVGAGIGAVCLLLTPERMFAQIVPLLLGFATLLFAYSERISRWLRTRAEGSQTPHRVQRRQPKSRAAGFVLRRLFRRRGWYPDAWRVLAGDRWRLSVGQRGKKFRVQPQ